MTALAWPLVTLATVVLVVWRLDKAWTRWASDSALRRRVAALEEAVSHKANLDDVAAVRDKLFHLDARVGKTR